MIDSISQPSVIDNFDNFEDQKHRIYYGRSLSEDDFIKKIENIYSN